MSAAVWKQSEPAPLQSNVASRWSEAKLPAPVSQGHKMYCVGPKRARVGGGCVEPGRFTLPVG